MLVRQFATKLPSIYVVKSFTFSLRSALGFIRVFCQRQRRHRRDVMPHRRIVPGELDWLIIGVKGKVFVQASVVRKLIVQRFRKQKGNPFFLHKQKTILTWTLALTNLAYIFQVETSYQGISVCVDLCWRLEEINIDTPTDTELRAVNVCRWHFPFT